MSTEETTDRDENTVWTELQKAGGKGPIAKALETELIVLLTKHGHAVCWELLRQHRPDVVNGAVMRILRAKFRGEAKFSTFAHRVFINECKRAAAKENTIAQREVGLEDLPHELHAPDAVEEMEIDELHELAEKLPPEDRRFYCDKICRDYDDEHLAMVYRLTPAGVRVRWHRIKKKLQALLRSTSGAAGVGKTSTRGRS